MVSNMMAKATNEKLSPQLECKVVHEVQVRTKLEVLGKQLQDVELAVLSQLVVLIHGFEDDLDLLLGPELGETGG